MSVATHVTTMLEQRSAHRLTRVAVELLQLDAGFRNAFPCERRSNSVESASLESRIHDCLADPHLRHGLPPHLRSRLEALLAPCARNDHLPTTPSRAALARDLLRAAAQMSDHASSAHLAMAQLDWLEGHNDAADRGFAQAFASARARGAAARALLHRAILQADDARVEDAVQLLERATSLDPRQLASHWTCAVYAMSLRRPALAEFHFRAALQVGAPHDVRRRALALEGQLLALADRGVGAPARARQIAARMLTQTTVLLSSGVVA